MLSKAFQRKIYDAYKKDEEAEIKHGGYIYAIAHNSACAIHTWIIRKGIRDNVFHWLQPLDLDIK